VSRLSDLEALRDDLLDWMQDAPVDKRAALVAQFRATLEEIDELTPKERVGDGIDEIAARRVARRSVTAARSRGSKRSG
jgi:hypothetical protein